MSCKIFIDGREGTTGLKICERFEGRNDVELLEIRADRRKDADERRRLINASDFTFLCLPDDAAKESVALCENPRTRIIDASTAHRVQEGWVYGFPELCPELRTALETAKRVAVPGCYASGFVALVRPLVAAGILPPDYPVTVHAVSGYSGAGKKAVAQYERPDRDRELDSPRLYALTQAHKHLPEMKKMAGLDFEPVFSPYICDYFQGMTVTVGLHARLLAGKTSALGVRETMAAHYDGCRMVKVADFMGEGTLTEPFIAANTLAGDNGMQIFVYGNDERIMLTARFDNLGKGASGAAVQCLNIMMGIDETTGLV